MRIAVFIQISDENVHRIRILMGEIFGENNFVSAITFATSTGRTTNFIANVNDHILWYARDLKQTKYHQLFVEKENITEEDYELGDLTSQGASNQSLLNFRVEFSIHQVIATGVTSILLECPD